jgi:hypothetical protein
MQYILNRLKERSTYLGIAGLLALAGIHLSQVQIDSLASAGIALVSALAVFLPTSSPK